MQSGKNRVNNAAYDFERIANDSKFEDDPWQNTFVRSRYEGMNATPGWTMPWQNAGEGALPDSEYTGDLPVYYTDNLERMHDESVEHTQQWIEQHGKYNPNLLLDGLPRNMIPQKHRLLRPQRRLTARPLPLRLLPPLASPSTRRATPRTTTVTCRRRVLRTTSRSPATYSTSTWASCTTWSVLAPLGLSRPSRKGSYYALKSY